MMENFRHLILGVILLKQLKDEQEAMESAQRTPAGAKTQTLGAHNQPQAPPQFTHKK